MKHSVKWLTAAAGCLAAASGILYCVSEGQAGNTLCINEIMPLSSNVIVERQTGHEDWIELYNGTDEDVNLEGMGLSNDPDEPFKYCFPDMVIKSKDFLVVFAEKDIGDGGVYTGFGLNKGGGYVLLTGKDGTRLDEIGYGECYSDRSYGRKPDGGALALLITATPGRSNQSAVSRYREMEGYGSVVTFSAESGYYQEPFDLILSCGQGETILYTLDGSEPSITSRVYDGPIPIRDRSGEPNQYAGIRTTQVDTFLNDIGKAPVKKGVVVRARAVKDGHLSRVITTKTFLFGQPPDMMTLSLVSDPGNLFDRRKGIYVPGDTYYYYSKTKKTPLNVYNLGNYSQRGEESERPVSISFIHPDGSVMAGQEAGIRISSGLMNTSLSPVKSLRLYASYKYDGRNIFPTEVFGPDADGRRLHVLVLRNHSDFINNVVLDVFAQRLLEGEGLGGQKDRLATVYLNGEYWGLTFIREWIDDYYVSDWYGLKRSNVAMIKYKSVGNMEVKYGRRQDLDDYLALIEYAKSHDLSVEGNYRYVAGQLDIDHYIKSCLCRIFLCSQDWPDNNVRYYRAIEPDQSEYGDGKWRSILYDMDGICAGYDFNMLALAMGEQSRTDSMGLSRPAEGSTELFSALMDQKIFRDKFRKQYEIYKRTVFSKDNMKETLDQLLEEMGPELYANRDRWIKVRNWKGKLADKARGGSEPWDLAADPDFSLQQVREFIDKREGYMDRQMKELYKRYGDE